jgi:hypothetical protein
MAGTRRTWRKSTYSSGANGMCVEVSSGQPHTLVRDSKRPTGPVLRFRPRAWVRFVRDVHQGAPRPGGR